VKTSNKIASNFPVTNDNQHGYSSDKDIAARPYTNYDFMATQEANEENEEKEEDDTESESSNNQDKSSDEPFTEKDEDIQGGHYIFSLTSGKRIIRNKW